MYWVLASERSDEHEISLYHVPPIIDTLGLNLDQGELVTVRLPAIDISFTLHPEERKTDNIVVPTRMGLLINNKVKEIFDRLGIHNIQYYRARLIEQNTQIVDENYYIANVIGKHAVVDHDESELQLFDDGDIEFIDKLVLNMDGKYDYGHIFRLAEFPELLIISQLLKDSLEDSRVTGFIIYRPEEFEL